MEERVESMMVERSGNGEGRGREDNGTVRGGGGEALFSTDKGPKVYVRRGVGAEVKGFIEP